jgi:hypothetical protein
VQPSSSGFSILDFGIYIVLWGGGVVFLQVLVRLPGFSKVQNLQWLFRRSVSPLNLLVNYEKRGSKQA